MAQLFRQEVLESRQREWLGTIRLTRPIPLFWATASIVAIAALVFSFLFVGQYTRKARVSGYLVPDRGVIRIASPQAATILESHVAEGRSVHEGDVLFVLAVGQSTLAGDTQYAVGVSLADRQKSLRGSAEQQTVLEAARLQAIDRRLEAMRGELETMAAEDSLQRQRQLLAEQTLAQFEAYRNENFVSEAQVRAKTEDLFGVKAQVLAVQRQRAAELREMASLEAERREIPIRGREQQGEIERGLALVAQQSAENSARQTIVLRAPQSGIVAAVSASVGQSVVATSGLASVIPEGTRLEARLFAPSSAVGFLRSEQSVLLRYQAFPYQKFGHQTGRILRVAQAPLPTTELATYPFLGAVPTEPLYPIIVSLDQQTVAAYGRPQALSPGMQLDADVLLDRRRLIEWIFEPVLGIAGRL